MPVQTGWPAPLEHTGHSTATELRAASVAILVHNTTNTHPVASTNTLRLRFKYRVGEKLTNPLAEEDDIMTVNNDDKL